jgi:parafibromin
MSTDALQALRTAITSGYEIIPLDASGAPAPSLPAATHLRLSDSLSFPKSAPTRLRKPGGNLASFFRLEAVYLAWLLRDASGAEYMKQARERGLAVGFVSVTERKAVVDWLEGRRAALDSVAPPAGASV